MIHYIMHDIHIIWLNVVAGDQIIRTAFHSLQDKIKYMTCKVAYTNLVTLQKPYKLNTFLHHVFKGLYISGTHQVKVDYQQLVS